MIVTKNFFEWLNFRIPTFNNEQSADEEFLSEGFLPLSEYCKNLQYVKETTTLDSFCLILLEISYGS